MDDWNAVLIGKRSLLLIVSSLWHSNFLLVRGFGVLGLQPSGKPFTWLRQQQVRRILDSSVGDLADTEG